MSTSSNSKAEQLARVRRNQQRSRLRKREHVAELERQVEVLQTEIRRCGFGDCNPESTLATIRKENAARRELLLSLGVDLVSQANYIASSVVDASQEIPQRASSMRCSSLPAFDDPDLIHGHAGRPDAVMMDGLAATGQSDSLSLLVSLDSDITLLESFAKDRQTEDWLFTDDPNEVLKIPFLETLEKGSCLSDPDKVRPEPLNASQLDTLFIPDPLPEGLADLVTTDHPRKGLPDEKAKCKAVSDCFKESAFQILPEGSSTACTKALSLILHLNRQGWSIATLQERLKPGIVQASVECGQCNIQDSVLFKVLTEISVFKAT